MENEVRKIVKNGRGSYYINIPKDLLRQLQWQEHQKLSIHRRGSELIVKDWKQK